MNDHQKMTIIIIRPIDSQNLNGFKMSKSKKS